MNAPTLSTAKSGDPLSPPARPTAQQPDAELKRQLAAQIRENMEPGGGDPDAVGVVGFMHRNGLRRNDSWRTVVKPESVSVVEAKLKEIGQKFGVDMLNPVERNKLIDQIYQLHVEGKIEGLPVERLQKLAEVAKSLRELAQVITPLRIRPISLGDYTAAEYHAAYSAANLSQVRSSGYISPIGRKISESASRQHFAPDYDGLCLQGVRLILEGAGVPNAIAARRAIWSVPRFRENPNFVEVTGLTVSEIDALPVGSVVVYNHPDDARRGRDYTNGQKAGHAQVKVLRPDGSVRWVSDTVQRDGTAYAMSPNQRAYVFVPRDYLQNAEFAQAFSGQVGQPA